MASLSGLSSGLDTQTIIDQLMAAERVPVDMLTKRMTGIQTDIDALGTVSGKLNAVDTAAQALSKSAGWTSRAATSSNTDIATVAVADNASVGGISFTVGQLASTHSVATASTSAVTDVIASSGSIELTIGATAHTISVASGSMSDVATAINAAGLGVRAATVNTGSGYRLQMTATSSGLSNAFSVTSGIDVATSITTQGADAQLTLGTGPGAYSITSASNTFTNVLPGVSVTAKQKSSEVVSIDVTRDVKGIGDKIQALVDSVNGAINEIKTRTAYDPKTKTAASLQGDASVRRASQDLIRALTDGVAQSSLGSPGLVGVSVDRYGMATFDRTKFTDAYNANPSAVERMFTQGATTTGPVSFVSAGAGAQAGNRVVVVTQAATQASVVGMVGAFPLTVPATIRVKIGSTEVVYPVNSGDTEDATRTGLQAALTTAGARMTVTSSGGGLKITADNYGSSSSFSVDWGAGTYTGVPGADVAGTIGGSAATGSGRQLSVPSTDGTLSGLSVLLTDDSTGSVGSVNYEPGLAQRLSSAVASATDVKSGYVTSGVNNKQTTITDISKSIDSYNLRLTVREQRLRQQYAKLEVTLSSLKSQGSALTSMGG